MNKLLVGLIVVVGVLISSCGPMSYTLCDNGMYENYVVSFEVEGIEAYTNNYIDLMKFCSSYITYTHETNGDYWQTPEETFELRTGDCEDISIFTIALLKRYFPEEEFKMVAVRQNIVRGHIILYSNNCIFYNISQVFFFGEDISEPMKIHYGYDSYYISYTYSYAETMFQCYTKQYTLIN